MRGEQQDSEIESAVRASDSQICQSSELSRFKQVETIDIRLPSAGELEAAKSHVSFEWLVESYDVGSLYFLTRYAANRCEDARLRGSSDAGTLSDYRLVTQSRLTFF